MNEAAEAVSVAVTQRQQQAGPSDVNVPPVGAFEFNANIHHRARQHSMLRSKFFFFHSYLVCKRRNALFKQTILSMRA